MESAGIDATHFQAHSISSASSTKAVELGHSIQDIKKYANWCLNSYTFEKFYYKPSSQELFCANYKSLNFFFYGEQYHVGSRSGDNWD